MKRLLYLLFLLPAATAAAQTPAQLRAYLPEVEGWTIADKVESFTPENLYDRINGAADAFLACNFAEMTQLSYNRVHSDTYITIQCYRHDTPPDAYCIYAGERFPDAEFLTIGAEGYREPQVLNFLSGNVYVKMETHDKSAEAGEAIEKIARTLAKKIDAASTLPALLQRLPEANKVEHSELYVSQSFLAHKFLHSAYMAQYREDGNEYRQFIIDAGTPDAAKQMIKEYLAFAKQEAEPKEKELITINDRYNGRVDMTWDGPYITGRTYE
ncbi:MAG: hypothetical protein LBF39_01615 [Prevotellaceae bacterium]|jgi:hypothetical protein|nr:hypothetical protein [Prevotellaceae bacterium]